MDVVDFDCRIVGVGRPCSGQRDEKERPCQGLLTLLVLFLGGHMTSNHRPSGIDHDDGLWSHAAMLVTGGPT